MQITIRNSPFPRHNRHMRKALEFYAKKLMHGNLVRNLILYVDFKGKDSQLYKDECDADVGPTCVRDLTEKDLPREFRMNVSSTLARNKLFLALAHEMIHVKQYATGELYDYSDVSLYDSNDDPWKVNWKGKVIAYDGKLLEYPWEIEAHGLENALFHAFKNSSPAYIRYFSHQNHSVCPHCLEQIKRPKFER